MDATTPPAPPVVLDDAGALLSLAARLLYANGEATQGVIAQVERVGRSIGYSVLLFPSWGALSLRLEAVVEPKEPKIIVVDCAPADVDMNKVMKTVGVVEQISARRLDVGGAIAALKEIAQLGPAPTLRFAALAGAGAAALGVVFGGADVFSLLLIAFSAAAGAVLRRIIAARGGNALAQVLGRL